MQPVKFDYENEPYRVFIDDVMVFPQGCAAVIGNMDELANEPSVVVCDIGSWTVVHSEWTTEHLTPILAAGN